MKTNALFYLATMLAATASCDTVNFDTGTPRTLPPHWLGTQTGRGPENCSIENADDAPSKPNVLKQSGEATFPVCIKEDTQLKDGFVEVKFKPVAGKEDRAGGVIWRCKDANNYYIARANALEDNVTIYHTIGGRRVAFKSANTKVASGVWHTLRVDFRGSHFTVIYDGTKLIEADDTSSLTLARLAFGRKPTA